jgi:exopolyphosphatase/guanosine-5'-triphosphate,3'-diphosphate pyrophosphatase
VIADSMGVARLDVFATAAVREASDGKDFARRIETDCGLTVRILGGDDEARLAAVGVAAAFQKVDGLVGDLGGGSLELVSLDGGSICRQTTLPLGPFRLMERPNIDVMNAEIDRYLDAVDWLDQVKGRVFFPVGGAWRTFARIHMNHANHPLRVIHHYRLDNHQANGMAGVIGRLSRQSLGRMGAIASRRRETLPYAALVLAGLLRRIEPEEILFSAYGVREGLILDGADAAAWRVDPLIEACAALAAPGARAKIDGPLLADWIAPIFEDQDPARVRLRLAASWLADSAGLEHPDYRSEHGFLRTLRMPAVAIDHPGRVFLALAVLARYDGDIGAEFAHAARRLLSPEGQHEALLTGLALSLASVILPGTGDALSRIRLKRDGDVVSLIFPTEFSRLDGELVQRRLGALNKALALPPSLIVAA